MSSVHTASGKQLSKFQAFYRSTFFQANVLGALAFTQPGIYTGLLSLGAGGQATTHTTYVATSLTNAIMTILAAPSAFFANRFGLKITMLIGTIGYTIYCASLYYNSKTGDQVFIIVASVILGISGACFWMAEGAIAMSYPENEYRGTFLAIWNFIYKFGSIIAGAIVFSLNKDGTAAGAVGLNTYIALFSIQCTGPLLALLLSSPEQVVRKDGTTVQSNINTLPFKETVRGWCAVLKRKEVLCLLPICIGNHWAQTWQSNFMTHNFSVRTRALNVLVTALIGAVADLLGGYFLDHKKLSLRFRARASGIFLALTLSGMFIWGFIAQSYVDSHDVGTLDYDTYGYYYNAYIPFQFFKVPYELIFVWIYWMVRLFPFNNKEIAYVAGIVRSFESLGGTLAYVVGVTSSNDMINLGVAAAVFWFAIPFFVYLAWTVNDDTANQAHMIASGATEEPKSSIELDSEFSKGHVVVEVNELSSDKV